MCVGIESIDRAVVGCWLLAPFFVVAARDAWHAIRLCVWPCPRPVDPPRWGLSPRRRCVAPADSGATSPAGFTALSTQLPTGPLISSSRIDSLLINYSIINSIREQQPSWWQLSLWGKGFLWFRYRYTLSHHCGAEHRHHFTTGKFWRRLQDGLSALDQVTEPHPRSNLYISPTCIS